MNSIATTEGITAVIPVRKGSTRCKNKNIRNFGDTNLLKLKIETLKKVNGIDKILVSSNCDVMLEIAKNMGVDIYKRNEKYCTNNNPGQFFRNLANTINTDILMHVPVTTPFISAKQYSEILNKWHEIKTEYNSLNATTKIKEFIWHNNEPVNYNRNNPPPSQELPNFNYLNFGCNIISKECVLKMNNIVSDKPFLFEIDSISGVDIDENSDFIKAELFYNNNITDDNISKVIINKRVDNPELVDCTIRDGGYLNNWEFTDEEVIDCYKAATKAGFDYFEIGFRTNPDILKDKGTWCYSSDSDIVNIKNNYNGCKIAVMAKVGSFDVNDFQHKKNSPVDMVRVLLARATHTDMGLISEYNEDDIIEASNICNHLIELGYDVCMNFGCGDLIEPLEIKLICKHFHSVGIKALYLADTYGGFNCKTIPTQIHEFYKEFNRYNSDMKLGFHIHNNNGDGLEKARLAAFHGCVMIDASIGGLGRGSGNLKTEEYVCHKFHKNQKLRDKITPIMEFYDKHIQSKKEYNNQKIKSHHPLYNVAGALSLHPDYILELLENVEQTITRDMSIIFQLDKHTTENNCRNYNRNLINKLNNTRLL